MSRRRSKRNSVLSILILEVGSLLGIVSIAQPNATRDLVKRIFQPSQSQQNTSMGVAVSSSSLPSATSRFASTADGAQTPWWSYRLDDTERRSSAIPEVGNRNAEPQMHVSYSVSNTDASNSAQSALPVNQPSSEINLVDHAAYLSARRLQKSSTTNFGAEVSANDSLGRTNRFATIPSSPSTAVDSGWKSTAQVTAPSYYY